MSAVPATNWVHHEVKWENDCRQQWAQLAKTYTHTAAAFFECYNATYAKCPFPLDQCEYNEVMGYLEDNFLEYVHTDRMTILRWIQALTPYVQSVLFPKWYELATNVLCDILCTPAEVADLKPFAKPPGKFRREMKTLSAWLQPRTYEDYQKIMVHIARFYMCAECKALGCLDDNLNSKCDVCMCCRHPIDMHMCHDPRHCGPDSS